MKKIVSFTVDGQPATAGSKTGFYNKKSSRVIMAPACKRQKPWMDSVRATAMLAYHEPPKEGAIFLEMTFKLKRPKSHYGSGKNAHLCKESSPIDPISKPDLTKLERAAEDALKGVLWLDDSQVCMKKTTKIYLDRFSPAQEGVDITVWEIG